MADEEKEVNPEQMAAVAEQVQKAVDLAGGDLSMVQAVLDKMKAVQAKEAKEQLAPEDRAAKDIVGWVLDTGRKLDEEVVFARQYGGRAAMDALRPKMGGLDFYLRKLGEDRDFTPQQVQITKVKILQELGLTLDQVDDATQVLRERQNETSQLIPLHAFDTDNVSTKFFVGFSGPAHSAELRKGNAEPRIDVIFSPKRSEQETAEGI